MPGPVALKNIVDALQMPMDEFSSFLNLDTGEVQTLPNQILRQAEEGEEPELPGWQESEFEVAKQIVSSDRFVGLPSKYDVHEWQIMEDFARSTSSARVREELEDALHGGGAFRNFKNVVRRRGIEKGWFAFRDEALKQIAIEWCQENEISWE